MGKKSNSKDYTLVENPYYRFIKVLEERKNRSTVWLIQCKNCGKFYKEIPAMLISETRRRGNNPCDCWRNTSKGALKIKNILIENNIKFQEEYKFLNCVSPKGNPMKFDFFVNSSYLIEYDGEQHFNPTRFYGGDRDNELEKFE